MNPHRILWETSIYKHTDLVQVQRWDQPHHVEAMVHFLGVNKIKYMPIVYDMDDDLYNLTEYNYFKRDGHYDHFLPMIEDIMGHSHLVTVSTQRLVKVWQHITPNIEVVPNFLPKWMWGEPIWVGPPKDEKWMNILWAGSGTHFLDEDAGDFRDFLGLIKENRERYRWIFFGDCPRKARNLPNVYFVPWRSMLELPGVYKSIRADIAVAPLRDNEFNKSKSNVKALEYTAAGIPGLYSDLEPYKSCKKLFKSVSDLSNLLEIYYNDIEGRKKLWEEDFRKLSPKMWLEDHFQERMNLYVKLMEGR
jgi:hypothetical protein